MKFYEYRQELIEEIPHEITLPKIRTLTTSQEWYGHSSADPIGRIYDNGRVWSYLEDDGLGSSGFDLLRRLGMLKSRRSGLAYSAEGAYIDYYLLRRVIGHSSTLPTIINRNLIYEGRARNHYTYEILLVANNEYRRYITYDIAQNADSDFQPCLLSIASKLETIFKDWADNNLCGFTWLNDNICCQCYSDFGDECNIEFQNMQELLLCVNSIRLVKLKKHSGPKQMGKDMNYDSSQTDYNKKYLVQFSYDGEQSIDLKTAGEILSIIDMLDCYPMDIEVYDVLTFGNPSHLTVFGIWHDPDNPLYMKVEDEQGKIVFDGYGTEH